MKKSDVVFDFIKLPISGKVGRGSNVTKLMTDNPNFPNPDVPLGDLNEATELLNSSYVTALGGGKKEKALMHQAEKAWDQLMRNQAMYVDRIAKGDHAIILSAGFNFSRRPIPAKRPEFSAVLGEKNRVRLFYTVRRSRERMPMSGKVVRVHWPKLRLDGPMPKQLVKQLQ